MAFNLSGSIANTGIAGQSASSGIVVPGGLVRASSATNGRAAIYDPSSIAFANTTTLVRGNHLAKFGADVRLIGMTFDQQGGTTYSFANIDGVPGQPAVGHPVPRRHQRAERVQQRRRPGCARPGSSTSSPSPRTSGSVSPHFTLNYGLRYDYYTPLTVKDDLFVKFNLETGTLDPNTVDLHGTKKNSFQPRLAATYNAGKTRRPRRLRRVRRAGPGRGPDPADRERPRQHHAQHRSAARLPDQHRRAGRQLHQQPEQPQLPAARLRRRVQHPGEGLPVHGVGAARARRRPAPRPRPTSAARAATCSCAASATRSSTSLTNPNPASAAFVIREFSLVERNAAGQVTRVQNPYAEVDFKTSGGHDEYNAMMLSLNRRSANGLAMNVQYTLGRSRGTSGGSNEANTAGNNARTLDEFEYENGYNNFDVRHTFNLSVLYSLPFGHGRQFGADAGALTQALLGGWEVGGIVNARSGLPVPVQIVRPDIVYQDATGNIFANPAAGRTAIINVPGGGASRNVRRPDLIPGVDPFIKDGGLLFLNPAAFATPAPGTFGNLERNAIHGPDSKQIDMFFAKHFNAGGRSDSSSAARCSTCSTRSTSPTRSARCRRRFRRRR